MISLVLFAASIYCGNPSSCQIHIAPRSDPSRPLSNSHSFLNSWLHEMLTQTDDQFIPIVCVKAILMKSFHLSYCSQYSLRPLLVSTQVQYSRLDFSDGL